jgi:hypothetical protein
LDQATKGYDAAAHADPPNFEIAKHLVVHLGAVVAAVLSRLQHGQARGFDALFAPR